MEKEYIEKLVLRIKALAGAMILAGTMTGCSREVDCDIDCDHLHLYENDNGYVTYVDSEKYVVVVDKETNEKYECEKGIIHEHIGQEKTLVKYIKNNY